MQKKSFLQLFRTLDQMGKLTGVRFAYAVAKNISKMKIEVESIEKSIKPPEGFMDYDQKRIDLAKKHSKKDEKGKEITANNEFQIEDETKFDKELKKLQSEYKKETDARQKQIDEYIKMLDEEIQFDFHKIDLKDVPAEITTQQMAGIIELINEEKIK